MIEFNGMNILITGGAGFIGSALAKKLKGFGHSVSILDLPQKITQEHESLFETYAIDIRDAQNYNILKGKSFDLIYHLAAQTSGVISQENPQLDVDTNVKGILNVCNFARAAKVKKIIFTSSMAVYGNQEGAIDELVSPSPLSNYGASKISSEYFLKLFTQYSISNTIFRLFNVYGPGQDMSNLRQGMASIFMAQSIASDHINVTGSLERYRDFVYIDDVVDALMLALEDCDGQTINVGSGFKTTVRELIDTIIEINDKDSTLFTVNNVGGHEGDQHGTIADNTLLTSLGWTPKVSLFQGLENMYEYAKKVIK